MKAASLILMLALTSGCGTESLVILDKAGTLYGASGLIETFSKEYVEQTIKAYQKVNSRIKRDKELSDARAG